MALQSCITTYYRQIYLTLVTIYGTLLDIQSSMPLLTRHTLLLQYSNAFIYQPTTARTQNITSRLLPRRQVVFMCQHS